LRSATDSHLFRAYQHLIDSTTDPTCQVCGEAPHTMENWLLDCPALSLTRMEIFGRDDLNLDVFATSPKQVIALVGGHSFTECALACLCHRRQQGTIKYFNRTLIVVLVLTSFLFIRILLFNHCQPVSRIKPNTKTKFRPMPSFRAGVRTKCHRTKCHGTSSSHQLMTTDIKLKLKT